MATGREQRTAAGVLARVPAELSVPGADAVVIINLPIVQLTQQALLQHRFGGQELAGVAALETNASFHAGLFDRRRHRQAILPGQRQRFLDNQMLARSGSGSVGAVFKGIAANRNDIQPWLRKERLVIGVGRNRAAVLGAEGFGVQRTRGIDGGDLRVRTGIDGGDMRGKRPTHNRRFRCCAFSRSYEESLRVTLALTPWISKRKVAGWARGSLTRIV